MTDKEKIKQFLEYKGESKRRFYKKTSLSNSFLESGVSFGVDKLRIIANNYKDLSIEWLLFDEGEMVINRDYDKKNEEVSIVSEQKEGYSNVQREIEYLKRDNERLEEIVKLQRLLLDGATK